MRDMNPRDRSIRNIPVPAGHRRVSQLPSDTYEEDFTEKPSRKPKRRRRLGGKYLWIGGGTLLFCVALGFLLSTVFAGATITVTPRTAQVAVPGTVLAQPNAAAGNLAYQVVTTSRTASTSVQATGTQKVSRPATGVITIYNEYSAESQRLIANTRFESPDGKIYRIHDSVVVPGIKNTGGQTVPGTATISLFADSPGDSYNIGESRLTIPGFKGDPRYDKFYAKTSGISGGFVGDEVAVAPADLQKAKDLLKQALEESLRSSAQTQIPKEYVVIPGTLAITYGNVTQTAAESGRATITQSASVTANIIRVSDLAAAIARQSVQGYKGEPVDLLDSTQVAIALDSASTSTPTGPLTLKLSGTPTVIWMFDSNALKNALLGKPKSTFEEVVQSLAPAIQCTGDTPCKASIRPFWTSTFPSDPDKITVRAE